MTDDGTVGGAVDLVDVLDDAPLWAPASWPASFDPVEAPGYRIDAAGLDLVVGAGRVVQSATGDVALTLPRAATAGQAYVVVAAGGLNTFEALDAAYAAGTPVAIGNVPAEALELVGRALDGAAIRTIIIANIQAGVAAYQAFELTFHPADAG